MSDLVDDVRTQWQAHLDRTLGWNEERTDADRDQLVALVHDRMRQNPAVGEQLRAELPAADGEWWDFLWALLAPDRELALSEPDAFRAHPEVAFTADQMPIAPSVGLARVTTYPSASDESALAEYTRTWFAGRPLAPAGAEWPRSHDGTPLAHVVQVCLDDVAEFDELAPVGLPPHGLLQVFHDLTTFGNAEDRGVGAWQVRWVDVEDLDELRPLEAPSDLDAEARVAPTPARVCPMATVPSMLDFDGDDDATDERYERVATWLEQYPYDASEFMAPDLAGDGSPWDEDPSLPEPVSRLGGYGYNESNPDYDDILDRVLPLDVGDQHVLLADVNPAQFTDADWFHGQRHLQVWIRRSDLTRRAFDDCWAFIRTDG